MRRRGGTGAFHDYPTRYHPTFPRGPNSPTRYPSSPQADLSSSIGPTSFTGYGAEGLEDAPATVVALLVDGLRVQLAGAGQHVDVLLDRTPFYAESGGQVRVVGSVAGAGLGCGKTVSGWRGGSRAGDSDKREGGTRGSFHVVRLTSLSLSHCPTPDC